jgi:heme-degrading monooxygenase HmoA
VPEFVTTGEWFAKGGQEDAFMDAWEAFVSWARTMPGAGSFRLTRDLGDPSRFVSFGSWTDLESAHAWKSDPGFPPLMGKVQEHVARFSPAELEVVRLLGDDGG